MRETCDEGWALLLIWTVHGVAYMLGNLDKPKCDSDEDCIGRMSCQAPAEPQCTPIGMYEPDYRRICRCSPCRWVPNPDGGQIPILMKCVRNPDGGMPLCGEWDAFREVILREVTLGEDGGVIMDEDGGTL